MNDATSDATVEGMFRQVLDQIPLPPRNRWTTAPKHRTSGWSVILAAASTAAVIVVGVTLGLGLQALRSGQLEVGSPSELRFDSRVGPVELANGVIAHRSIRLVANGPVVTARLTAGLPQRLEIVDEETGEVLYTLASRFGPGHPDPDQRFLQFFVSSLRGDGSEQVVYTYGSCEQRCSATTVRVLTMDASHRVVYNMLNLTGLEGAVAAPSSGELLVAQEDPTWTIRRYVWDPGTLNMVEVRTATP